MAEQFRIHQLPGQRTAVHGKERPLSTGAVLMDDARKTFLAHAALSLDEDTEAGGREFHGRFQRVVERRIVADDIVFVF